MDKFARLHQTRSANVDRHDGQTSKGLQKDAFMKKNSLSLIVMFILVGTLLASAREITAPHPVAALAATDAPTEVIAPLPTEAPALPIATEMIVPASPTPSRMEFSVQNASMEVKVLDIEKPHQVYLGFDSNSGSELIINPGPENMFLGLGIKVSNFTGADIPMKWSDVYLVNKYQDKWYPVWGAYKKTNAAMDPLTIEILQADQVHPDFDPDAYFHASDNGYVRAIFRVPRDNLYYFFGLADLPLIEINWRYY